MNNESYLIGDIRYNNDITPIDNITNANIFLIELQELMNLYGVVKIDISIDIYKYNQNKQS